MASWQEQADSATPTVWNYGYDNADQLTSATKLNASTSAVLSQYVYGYDLAGNRTTEQNGLSLTQTSVNSLNQMTGSSAGGSLQFAGSLSKPSKVTVAGQTATYGNYYSTNFAGMANVTSGTNSVAVVATDVNGNAATNNYQVVVPSGSATSPTYDANGNLTNNGNGQAYTWDAKNELASIVYSSGSNAGNHTEFTYDGLGRRVAIVERTGTTLGSGTVTSTKQFLWVSHNIAEERDASDAVTKRFFPQGEQISGTAYYYTRDHLGSVREMINNSGSIEARYSYDPYGRATKVSGSMDADFQYAGYYEHAVSGLSLTLYRAYDSNTAKWLARDPMGEGSDATLYSYVANNPIWAIDPLGLDWILFNGTSATWYQGNYPDTSHPNGSSSAASGLPGHQSASQCNNKDAGPVPPGSYRIDLRPDPTRVAPEVDLPDGTYLSPSSGITLIPSSGGATSYPNWGNWRARLIPNPGTDTNGRDSLYLHDSGKGFSHGCVDVQPSAGFYDKLNSYRGAGNTSIDVHVSYPSPSSPTGPYPPTP